MARNTGLYSCGPRGPNGSMGSGTTTCTIIVASYVWSRSDGVARAVQRALLELYIGSFTARSACSQQIM